MYVELTTFHDPVAEVERRIQSMSDTQLVETLEEKKDERLGMYQNYFLTPNNEWKLQCLDEIIGMITNELIRRNKAAIMTWN